jgi:hypothetical protein
VNQPHASGHTVLDPSREEHEGHWEPRPTQKGMMMMMMMCVEDGEAVDADMQ